MNQTLDILNQIKNTTKRTEKEQILLDAWLIHGERNLFRLFQLAYDNLKPFYIKKIDKKVSDNKTKSNKLNIFQQKEQTFDDFVELCNVLHDRIVTGNAAIDCVRSFMDQTDADVWNELYRPTLLKDLRCGITETTVNKLLKKISKTDKSANDYAVKIYSVQLAHPGEKYPKRLTGKKWVDVKLDGVRLTAFVYKSIGEVELFTRNGRQSKNFPHVEAFFKRHFHLFDMDMVFDGEIMGNNFRDLMTQINRKDDLDTGETSFRVFDVLPVHEFKQGKSVKILTQRLSDLNHYVSFFSQDPECSVKPLDRVLVDLSSDEYKKLLEQAVSAGHEGIMLKDPDSYYVCDRTADWLKIKPYIEVTLMVRGFEEGTGKNVGRLGTMYCAGEDDYGRIIEVDVGGGFTDEEREHIWNNREKYVGFYVEVRADGITSNRKSENDVYSLRFPRFKGFRGTEPGEKI